MMLTRLYVDNFKCFVNFDFRPGPRQLLLGPNGSGKSSVFDVLSRLRDFSARGVPADDLFMGETLTRWQSVQEQRFNLEVSGNGGTYEYELVVDQVGISARPRVVREAVKFDTKQIFLFETGQVHLHNDAYSEGATFRSDWHRSFLANIDPRTDNTKLTWFKDWLGAVQCVQINPRGMSARADKEAVFLAPDASNYASWYRHLVQEQNAAISSLRDDLLDVVNGFVSLDLKEAGQGVRIIKATFRLSQGDKTPPRAKDRFEFGFDELSDGQRTLVALYTLLHCCVRRDALLCIDEPDNFVSLAEIQPWLYKLVDMADQENAQFFLASHHPELLNQLAADYGIVFVRAGSRNVTVAPFVGSPGSELPPAEQIARGWANV
jgi:predicted ATPase